MAEFAKVMKEQKRLCRAHKNCCDCPLYRGFGKCAFKGHEADAIEVEKIVMKWAEEHPIMTNKDKFEDIFACGLVLEGCAGLNCDGRDDCDDCPNKNFWEREYEPKGEE